MAQYSFRCAAPAFVLVLLACPFPTAALCAVEEPARRPETQNQNPPAATQGKSGSSSVPVEVGYTALENIDDVREAVLDLTGMVSKRGPELLGPQWNDQKPQWDSLNSKLQEMGPRLRDKKNEEKESWGAFVNADLATLSEAVGKVGVALASNPKAGEVLGNSAVKATRNVARQSSQLVGDLKDIGGNFEGLNLIGQRQDLLRLESEFKNIDKSLGKNAGKLDEKGSRELNETLTKMSAMLQEVNKILGNRG